MCHLLILAGRCEISILVYNDLKKCEVIIVWVTLVVVMFDISFESDDDKWKWGGILGGVGLALVATGVMVGCLCRNCLRVRASQRATRMLYEANAKQTVLCVDGDDGARRVVSVPSAPPYDGAV